METNTPLNYDTRALIACTDCDLLIQAPQLKQAENTSSTALCPRCNAVLLKQANHSASRTLALAIAAFFMLLLANAFPILTLQIGSESISCSIFGAADTLYQQGMWYLSAIIIITTIITPALQLMILLYLLIPIALGKRPQFIVVPMKIFNALHPWSMIEVFMLGILISLSKLMGMARIEPDVALWSIAILMLLLTATLSTFNPKKIWQLLTPAHQ
ncbi:paraquat-inducible protein A [Deefgea piscis]|uniref:paraquat-inducible protein A n=1 Tax=Deefgea piscis TaxID=2739061 RepID=UPI001C7E9B5A|nr:paraquat-inducible protein A [Deefgea piscis]QZA79643.1 paraquat-inducible protein A [Deefgea piscis]